MKKLISETKEGLAKKIKLERLNGFKPISGLKTSGKYYTVTVAKF